MESNTLSRVVRAVLLCLLLAGPDLHGQGTAPVNIYTGVRTIDNAARALMVADATGFTAGDQVLLIQMQGTQIDGIDAPGYGTIRALNGCGSYELGVIARVTGNRVELTAPFAHDDYAIAGHVQLVRVAVYDSISIADTLACPPWNGTTGGVLALVAGCIVLEPTGIIQASGAGFRGGEYLHQPGCAVDPNTRSYVSTSKCQWSPKGEGIAGYGIGGAVYGKGGPANGGGGGNNHNAGGGGGANMGAGGAGGHGYTEFSYPDVAAGVGGHSLAQWYAPGEGRAFMGGGGGTGHINNLHGSGGANGGGIILIRAGHINGGGGWIRARGFDAENDISTRDPDGCGGGGAGGTIILDVESMSGLVIADVSGGNGGSRVGVSTPVGSGGGGGGGVVIVSGDTAGVTCLLPLIGGGRGGTVVEGGTFGAGDGMRGGIVTRYPVPGETTSLPVCSSEGECVVKRSIPEVPPVLTRLAGDCYGFVIQASDSLWPIVAVDLDSAASSNVSVEIMGGLPSHEVAVRVIVADPSRAGVVSLLVRNSRGKIAPIVESLAARTGSRLVVHADPDEHASMDSIWLGSSRCMNVGLGNPGPDAVVLGAASFRNNVAFSVPPGQFPLVIPPGESRDCEICFAPGEPGADHDTLVLRDLCDVYIPVDGYGLFHAEGRNCDAVIGIREAGSGVSKVAVAAPYPNPGGRTIHVPVTILGDRSAAIPAPPVLRDGLGNVVRNPGYGVLSSGGTGNRYREEGIFSFDITGLAQGVYWLMMVTSEGPVGYPVVVER